MELCRRKRFWCVRYALYENVSLSLLVRVSMFVRGFAYSSHTHHSYRYMYFSVVPGVSVLLWRARIDPSSESKEA